MKYRPLGNTGLEVSAVAMGCWAISGDATWGPQPQDMIGPTVDAAIDAGINFFDTARAYGSSEKLLGQALGSRRKDVIVASKIGSSMMEADQVIACCEASLTDLGCDSIDLMQVHWPSDTVPYAETFGALDRLREQGKIRFIGVSNFGPRNMAQAKTCCAFESNQLAYNLLFRAVEFAIAPACQRDNIGILAYSPLQQGLLTGKFASADQVPDGRARSRHFDSNVRPEARHGEAGHEAQLFRAIDKVRAISDQLGHSMADVALAWLLHQPAMTSVLAGARRPQQIHDNVRAADLQLDDATLTALSAATDPLKQAMGDNADMWVGGDSSRIG